MKLRVLIVVTIVISSGRSEKSFSVLMRIYTESIKGLIFEVAGHAA